SWRRSYEPLLGEFEFMHQLVSSRRFQIEHHLGWLCNALKLLRDLDYVFRLAQAIEHSFGCYEALASDVHDQGDEMSPAAKMRKRKNHENDLIRLCRVFNESIEEISVPAKLVWKASRACES